MTQFLIGCTHFGHKNIIRLADRPFNSVEEMDEALIRTWNKTVKPFDTVYHLGDFAFRGAPAEEYLKRLNGNVVTLQGNHDSKGWGKDIIDLKINKTKVVLCHYPIEEWDGWWRGSVHFHCHTHKREFKSANNRGNVGVDAIGLAPIRLEDAVKIIGGMSD